ncbi:aldehyde dehydrogenase (NADP(+)), partial [bacterium]|nr:aldehyde dehydrogenase (NADP(+)) [bacterium]
MQKILINGDWTSADSTGAFQAFDPRNGTPIDGDFPVSSWNDCLKMVEAASRAACELENVTGTEIANFLRCYADN